MAARRDHLGYGAGGDPPPRMADDGIPGFVTSPPAHDAAADRPEWIALGPVCPF